MDYWNECVSEALDEAGLEASEQQIEKIAGWVEGAHDNYGMATGRDVAVSNYHANYESKIRDANARTETEVRATAESYEKRICELKSNYERRINRLLNEIERLRSEAA